MDSEQKKYSIGFRVWIKEENGHYLGRGRITLLEQIRSNGSITKAAKAMQMSYRQAWQMVEDMNKLANEILVEKILGGKGGGGAKLTKEGEHAIEVFYLLEEKIKNYSEKLSKEINL